MTRDRVRRAILILLLAASSIAGVVMAGSPPSPTNPAITVEPGVTFSLTGGYANITFAQTQYLQTQVTFPNSHAVQFDLFTFSVQKLPAAYPSVAVTIQTYSVAAVTQGVPALVFDASAPTGSIVWFNLTNLIAGLPYTLKVDNQTNKLTAAQTTGELDFSWTSWSSHRFEVDVTASYNQAPGSVPFGCDSAPVFPFVTRLHCAAPPGSNATGWEWQANGRVVGKGASMDYYLPGMSLGASTVLVDLLGYRPNGTFPQVVGAQIVPVDTTQASAIGWGTVTVLVILALLALSGRRSLPNPHNPTYRESAIKVSFYPDRSANPNWVSFRQRPLRYARYTSRHRNGVWVVYGIRTDGRSEIQTVREPVEDAPQEWVRRALQHAPAGRREQIAENLKRRGVL